MRRALGPTVRALVLTVAAVLVAGGFLAAPAGAASSSPEPGITSSSITVGQVDTLSGPVPGLFLGAKVGTEAYFDYINSKGGVNGRKLHVVAQDDQFSGATYEAETQQLVKSTFALVGGFSLFDQAGVAAINAAKIPDVTQALTAQRSEDQYNYEPIPIINGGDPLGPWKYYKAHYGSAYKSMGVIVGNVASAVSSVQGFINAVRSIGYKVTYYHAVNPVSFDFTPDILRMKSSGVQIVFPVGISSDQFASFAKQMAQQGYHPKLFLNSTNAYNTQLIGQAGTAAVEGLQIYMSNAMYLGQDAKSVPAIKTFLTWTKKADPSATTDLYELYGWTSAQLFVQALQNAGKNPTRASVLGALDKITSFNASGLLATGNPAGKRGATCWIQVAINNGKYGRVSPSPKSGYICNPGGFYYPPGYSFKRQPPPSS